VTSEEFSAAKELFVSYDGSRFYMSRNNVEVAYQAYNVPQELERAWLAELTEQKVAALQSPGNWRSITFLQSHQDCRHIADVLRARPLGLLWQRIAFVEEQLAYVLMCRGRTDPRTADPGFEQVLANARALESACRSERTRLRVDRLIAQAEQAHSTP